MLCDGATLSGNSRVSAVSLSSSKRGRTLTCSNSLRTRACKVASQTSGATMLGVSPARRASSMPLNLGDQRAKLTEKPSRCRRFAVSQNGFATSSFVRASRSGARTTGAVKRVASLCQRLVASATIGTACLNAPVPNAPTATTPNL
jgi:hypothetical protein